MGRREGIWAGKISGHQQATKGISFKKCSVVSLHKVKIKDTPSLRYSERKIMLGRKGRGCGKGWEQLERNSSGTDRQAVTKSVNYLKNKLTQKRMSWGGRGGRTSGYPSIMHKPAQGHCEKGSCGHHHRNVTRSWPQPTTQHSTVPWWPFVTPGLLCFVTRVGIHKRKQRNTKAWQWFVFLIALQPRFHLALPWHSGTGQPGASLPLFGTVTTTNNWVLSKSQLHPGWLIKVSKAKGRRQE